MVIMGGMTGSLRPELPPPACVLGYPIEQLRGLLSGRTESFIEFMQLSAHGVCAGHACRESHGDTYYRYDVERFLERQI